MTITRAYTELVRIEEALRALADQEPDGLIQWGFAEAEASHALQALEPAVVPAPGTGPATDGLETARALAEAADSAARTLVDAAESAADPARKLACLEAALHAGRLRDALG